MNVSRNNTSKNFVYKCRKRLGLTQVQLARMMGVTRLTIIRWEHSDFPPLYTVYKLAHLLDCDPADVLRGV